MIVVCFLLAVAVMGSGGPSFPPEPLRVAESRPLRATKEAVAEAILGNCFLAGTLVETASRGGVAVEDVRVGDRIAPPPGHEGCIDPRCGDVVRLFRNQATDCAPDVQRCA